MSDDEKLPPREDFSSLDKHLRQGKTFVPPLMQIPGLTTQSWYNDRLPEMLWAALLVEALPRNQYITHLSLIAKAAMQFRGNPEVYPQHSAGTRLSTPQFMALFGHLLADDQSRRALSPLLLLDKLPDRAHWSPHLDTPAQNDGWLAIANAIANCAERRQRPAIDIRWLRVMFLCLQHRMVFPQGKAEEIVEMLCAYPECAEPSGEVDAIIASMEGVTGHGPFAEDVSFWNNTFWDECLYKTGCIPAQVIMPESGFEYEPAKKRWGEIYARLVRHFFETLKTSGVDPKHDAVFGLALYAMSLVTGMMRPHSTRPSGRHLLRSLVEVHITLAYLVAKDDADVWQMYRAYGTGQAKLAFLKLIERERDDFPRHVDVGMLEQLANEDMWQEFVPIDVGQWANLTVRKMADEAGVKDLYDSHYVWPSGFVHGHWGAVRDSVFDICANPLHRFHRIPRPMRVDMHDVCFDAVDLMNRTLDLVERTYPGLSERFAHESMSPKTPSPTGAGEPET